MLDLPVLAAGTVGTCLGFVLADLIRRAGANPAAHVQALRQADRERGAAEMRAVEATVDRDLANIDAAEAQALVVEAHNAMGLLAQRLSDEMRARAVAERRAATAEEHIAWLSPEIAA